MTGFSCPRTCPQYGDSLCRFRPILDQIGPARVCSHTVKVKVDYNDLEALRRAVLSMSGTWLATGTHQLFDGQSAHGQGIQLPNWRYPIVLDAAGEMHYDDYGGQWGRVSDLDTLRAEYAIIRAETVAREIGWQTERTAQGLTVYHPAGGALTLSRDMTVDTTGFIGSACHEAREALGLAVDGEVTTKPEALAVPARINLPLA